MVLTASPFPIDRFATGFEIYGADSGVVDSELEKVKSGTIVVLTKNGSSQSSYQEYDLYYTCNYNSIITCSLSML